MWVFCYSLTPYIIQAAFEPEPAVYTYTVNFVYMHMAGNMAMCGQVLVAVDSFLTYNSDLGIYITPKNK